MRKTKRGVLVLAAGIVLAACGKTQAAPSRTPGWEAPPDPVAAAGRAGLPSDGREMLAVHKHAHLDVIVDAKAVVVPANLGIQRDPRRIAPLHTHDTTGIVHIESATDRPFTLGQVFILWDKPLSVTRVGPVRVGAGEVLRIYRDGTEVSGDPAALELTQHAEIVVWVGPRNETPKVPASYAFPSGT